MSAKLMHGYSAEKRPALLFKMGSLGCGPGRFNFPTHATFMPTGDILVSDKNNGRSVITLKRWIQFQVDTESILKTVL